MHRVKANFMEQILNQEAYCNNQARHRSSLVSYVVLDKKFNLLAIIKMPFLLPNSVDLRVTHSYPFSHAVVILHMSSKAFKTIALQEPILL